MAETKGRPCFAWQSRAQEPGLSTGASFYRSTKGKSALSPRVLSGTTLTGDFHQGESALMEDISPHT